MAKALLIVESPAKSKTIEKYLGKDFTVLASYGHIRDLIPKNGAVDPKNDFAMKYDLIERNERHVGAIERAAKHADIIYLATDPDREGEAISWHILEILKGKGLLKNKRVHRVVFTEITPGAVKKAVDNPRDLDMHMVDAQQARRALDFLVGFTLSPVLWRKVQKGLSAGRVQSPALRLIVERQEEIEAFVPQEYWSIHADAVGKNMPFQAKLHTYEGKRLEQFSFTNEVDAELARKSIENAAHGQLKVKSVTSKPRTRKPAPPFTTSTLQQEAARKLGFGTSKTMQIAQKLYEGIDIGGETVGLISYMRTDSVNLSEDALADLRSTIKSEYGGDALPDSPNFYSAKSKNAQEAHEAVRPTLSSRLPSKMARYLDHDQKRLYELIWKRTMACQMKPALLSVLTIELDGHPTSGQTVFRVSGSTVVFPGFLAVYEEGKDAKGKDDDDEGRKLPDLKEGETVNLMAVNANQHFTEPPAAFSEASLVKALEEFGIGRPSTYAAIIKGLESRNYVINENKRFMPTDVGRAVSHFLTQHFGTYVDYKFTSGLEDELDAVSRGEMGWKKLLEGFWDPFASKVKETGENVDRGEAQGARELGTDPKTGQKVSVHLGRFGPYVALDYTTDRDKPKPKAASLLPHQTMYTITLEEALELFILPRDLGKMGEDEVSAGIGKFGPFVKRGKVYVSIPEGESAYTITFDRAKELIAEKEEMLRNRYINVFENGKEKVEVLNGKFGPYVTSGGKNGKIPKDVDPKTVTMEMALAYIEEAANAPKKFGGGGGGFKKKGFKKGGKGGFKF